MAVANRKGNYFKCHLNLLFASRGMHLSGFFDLLRIGKSSDTRLQVLAPSPSYCNMNNELFTNYRINWELQRIGGTRNRRKLELWFLQLSPSAFLLHKMSLKTVSASIAGCTVLSQMQNCWGFEHKSPMPSALFKAGGALPGKSDWTAV